VLGGQPDGLDVLGEGDLAAGVVEPGAVADFGFLAVRGAFGGTPGGVGAGGALSALGVAVAEEMTAMATHCRHHNITFTAPGWFDRRGGHGA
jgi:hypothetical protein